MLVFFFSSRRRHTRFKCDWSSDVCSSDLLAALALAIPAQLAAQGSAKEHIRYKLIDLGTLGGPHSYGSVNGEGFQLLNDAGVISSFADTASPDPFAPNFCYNPLDCFMSHAFRC